MAMREEEAGRSALSRAAYLEPDAGPPAPAAPAPRPKRPGPPLTTFHSADELYAAMAAQRQANLAKLAEAAAPETDPGAAARKSSGARVLGRSLLVGLAAVAAALRRK